MSIRNNQKLRESWVKTNTSENVIKPNKHRKNISTGEGGQFIHPQNYVVSYQSTINSNHDKSHQSNNNGGGINRA